MIPKDKLKFIITEWNVWSEHSVLRATTTGTPKFIAQGISKHDQEVINDLACELWAYRYPDEPVPEKGVKECE